MIFGVKVVQFEVKDSMEKFSLIAKEQIGCIGVFSTESISPEADPKP